jgi:ABC-2 type transport system permease protein
MNLIRIELHKILPYRTFWVILAIFTSLMILILYASSNVAINGREMGSSIYRMPNFWMTLTYTASFFNLLFGILIIVLITDEYTFRTFRQQVIDGLSRADLVLSKFYVILLLATFGTIFLFVLGAYFGILYNKELTIAKFAGKIDALSFYFVQAVGYMTLAMFIGFMIRKSGLAIISFVAYSQIVEPLIHFRLPDNIDKFMPIKVFKSLTPMPGQDLLDQLTTPTGLLSPSWAALFGLVYILFFCLLSFLTIRMRDL